MEEMIEFIYPIFNKATHYIKKDSVSNTSDYPSMDTYEKYYDLPKNLKVTVLREGVGNKCKWSHVVVNDLDKKQEEYNKKRLFIKSSNSF